MAAYCRSAASVTTRRAYPQQDVKRAAQKIVQRGRAQAAVDIMAQELQQYWVPYAGYNIAPGRLTIHLWFDNHRNGRWAGECVIRPLLSSQLVIMECTKPLLQFLYSRPACKHC